VITLVRLAFPTLNAQRECALVIANRHQQRRPFAGRARRITAHVGDCGGDRIELRALFRIAAIFHKTRQRIDGGAYPRRVIALGEGERREAQCEREHRRRDESGQ